MKDFYLAALAKRTTKPTAEFSVPANASAKLYITGSASQKITVYTDDTVKFNWTLPKSASSFSVTAGMIIKVQSDLPFTVETYDNLTPLSAKGCTITGFN